MQNYTDNKGNELIIGAVDTIRGLKSNIDKVRTCISLGVPYEIKL